MTHTLSLRRASAWMPVLAASVVGLIALGTAAPAHDLDEDEVKRLALEAILENPGIVMEAARLVQERQAAEAAARAKETLLSQRDRLEQDPNAPVVGNPDGDVTLVEFFDYNCPYCRRAGTAVGALLAQDPNIRVVYREWPVLSEGSVYAARAALAARKQGRYEDMHKALMGLSGRVGQPNVLSTARSLGLDIDQLQADMDDPSVDEHLASSAELARALGFSGTPSFVMGETLLPGLVTTERLAEVAAEIRGLQN